MRLTLAFKSGLCIFLAVAVQAGSAMTLFMGVDADDGHAFIIANDAMLNAGDAVKIRRFLNLQAQRGIPTAIFITSPGGFGELMSPLSKAIIEPSNELLKKHNLFNMVIINEECSSACIILISHLTNDRNPRALRILVALDAKFGFHSPVQIYNGVPSNFRESSEGEFRIRTQIQLLTAAGVNPEWLKDNGDMLRSPLMKFLTGDNICSSYSRILTEESCIYGPRDLGRLASNIFRDAQEAERVSRINQTAIKPQTIKPALSQPKGRPAPRP